MLGWLKTIFGRQDASQTASGQFVTSEQLELRLGEYTKEREWEYEEWLEKFGTLHRRLAKRAARDAEGSADERSAAAAQPAGEDVISLTRAARARGLL